MISANPLQRDQIAIEPEFQLDAVAVVTPSDPESRGESCPEMSLRTAEVNNLGAPKASKRIDAKIVFLMGLLLAASGFVSAPVALVGGIAYGFSVDHPMKREASLLAKLLLQLSVVLLGFGINLDQVIHAGKHGFLYTAVSIGLAVALGLLLGRLLRIGGKVSYLITMGTAICGGSAIAALAPITEANGEEISISMGTVFLLNSIALLLFPAIGWRLGLSQNQFGLWAALAIHDTSSVVGAAARYGTQALAVGTTVKLARALWIVPISFITASIMSRVAPANGRVHQAKVKLPWFIAAFLFASVAATYFPRFATIYADLNRLGKLGLTANAFSYREQPVKENSKASRYSTFTSGRFSVGPGGGSIAGCNLFQIYCHLGRLSYQ